MDDYHLTRNDFELSTANAFKSLISDQNFADVTLACTDDKQVTAHKVILAASSPFFNHILMKNPHQHPLIYLKGINSVDLEAIIRFIYTGETSLAHASLDTFLAAAQELQVHGLLVDSDVKTLNKTNQHEVNDELTRKAEEGESDNDTVDPCLQELQVKSLEDTTFEKCKEIDIQKFGCEECDFVSSYRKNLRRHRVKVHKSPAKLLTTTDKNVTNVSEQLLKESLSFDSSPISSYKCNYCDFFTVHKKNLRRHMQKTHEKPDPEELQAERKYMDKTDQEHSLHIFF